MAGDRPWTGRSHDRWWREPPAWAWIVIVVGVLTIGLLAPFAVGRGQLSLDEIDRINDQSAQEGSSAAAEPASATPGAIERATDVPTTRIVVIGDSDTGGFGDSGTGEASWPALLGERVPGVDVQTVTAPGAGYATADPDSGQTLPGLVAAAAVEEAALVVVFGSRNDGSGIADKVGDAADALFADIRTRASDAQLVVIGPLWPSETVPAGIRNNRDVIAAAANAAGATFVDPLANTWFVDDPSLIGIDGVHLTDAGHAFIADQVEPVVRSALGL